jgi:chemotaxis protein methyltransferase WspC
MGHPLIESMLRESMGLDIASIGSASIERALRDRMTASKSPDADSYAQLLAASPTEMQELIEAVVVPETWFFRNPEAFKALAALAAGEWAPAHPGGTLRVLSFPCSTGEEPYSIAIALLESGLPRERFTIDGFDISGRALERAARGVYGRNSFRGSELSFVERYFRREEGGRFLLDELVRTSVRFEQRNVVDEDFATRQGQYDVIFCRNVLIYFDPLTQQRALRNLAGALRTGGTLFVGPAESFQVVAAGFLSLAMPQAFAFQKGADRVPDLPAIPPSRVERRPAEPRAERAGRARIARARGASAQRNGPPSILTREAPRDVADDLTAARRLADSGDLKAALALAERSLSTAPPTPEGYYVLGLIRDAIGDSAGAMDAYRKALYLDPDHIDALLHLAFLLERGGDAASAQRFRERARRAEERKRS